MIYVRDIQYYKIAINLVCKQLAEQMQLPLSMLSACLGQLKARVAQKLRIPRRKKKKRKQQSGQTTAHIPNKYA